MNFSMVGISEGRGKKSISKFSGKATPLAMAVALRNFDFVLLPGLKNQKAS